MFMVIRICITSFVCPRGAHVWAYFFTYIVSQFWASVALSCPSWQNFKTLCNYSPCSAWIAKSKPFAAKTRGLQAASSQIRLVLPAKPLDLTIQRERLSSYDSLFDVVVHARATLRSPTIIIQQNRRLCKWRPCLALAHPGATAKDCLRAV